MSVKIAVTGHNVHQGDVLVEEVTNKKWDVVEKMKRSPNTDLKFTNVWKLKHGSTKRLMFMSDIGNYSIEFQN